MKFALTAALLLTSVAYADTYSYQGNPFTTGTISGTVSGSFTISGELESNLNEEFVFPSSWSFTDGTRTISSSALQDLFFMEVTTNALGQITGWVLEAEAPEEDIESLSGVGDSTGTAFSYGRNTSTGTWTDVSAVPEPSSLAMLGTGLLGVGGILKRRLIA